MEPTLGTFPNQDVLYLILSYLDDVKSIAACFIINSVWQDMITRLFLSNKQRKTIFDRSTQQYSYEELLALGKTKNPALQFLHDQQVRRFKLLGNLIPHGVSIGEHNGCESERYCFDLGKLMWVTYRKSRELIYRAKNMYVSTHIQFYPCFTLLEYDSSGRITRRVTPSYIQTTQYSDNEVHVNYIPKGLEEHTNCMNFLMAEYREMISLAKPAQPKTIKPPRQRKKGEDYQLTKGQLP